jgi:hypothetical protein
MATERAISGGPDGRPARPEEDGLLAYLGTLYRVAHARHASHWCTPGHNRGRALAEFDERPVLTLPLLPLGRQEAV